MHANDENTGNEHISFEFGFGLVRWFVYLWTGGFCLCMRLFDVCACECVCVIWIQI